MKKQPDQYDRMLPGNKPKNIPARGDHAGAPSSPSAQGYIGGSVTKPGRGEGATVSVGRRPDEVDRSSVKTAGSVRTDVYTGPGRTKGDPVRFGVPQLKKGKSS